MGIPTVYSAVACSEALAAQEEVAAREVEGRTIPVACTQTNCSLCALASQQGYALSSRLPAVSFQRLLG